ncbi:MAG: hypothetical protein KTQ49_06630, partial [Candidatus Omnitrophica bacterium]|nr:hypothetical protein [Candidatus Omnitrophota bacterium]
GEGASVRGVIETARQVTDRIVAVAVAKAKAYLAMARDFFRDHFRETPEVPAEWAASWPVYAKVLTHPASASDERLLVDQRHGVPDTSSVLPLLHFARYNPKAEVVLALIADAAAAEVFQKELKVLEDGLEPLANFKVMAYADEGSFVKDFSGLYNNAAPLGKAVALVTDRGDSVVTQKIGARRRLLSVVGAADPLKQTASVLLAADKLLDESVWSLGYHFVPIETLGGLEALMAELAGFIAAQAKILTAA